MAVEGFYVDVPGDGAGKLLCSPGKNRLGARVTGLLLRVVALGMSLGQLLQHGLIRRRIRGNPQLGGGVGSEKCRVEQRLAG